CLIPIYKCKPAFGRSFTALHILDRLLRRFATFACSICSFHGGSVVGHLKEELCGGRSNIMMCCGVFSTQPLQEPLSFDAHAQRRQLMARCILRMCLALNGWLL